MKYNEVMNNPAYMKYLRAINVVSYSLVLEFEDDGPICVKNRFGYNKIPLINLENGKEIASEKKTIKEIMKNRLTTMRDYEQLCEKYSGKNLWISCIN